MSPSLPNPYEVLGVDTKASAGDIKKAYRKLAKENHPDSNAGCKAKESRFKDISAAYNILSDPQKRARYDAMGAAGGAGIPDGVFDLGDLFAQMFQGGAAGANGSGVRYEVRSGGRPNNGGSGGGFRFPDLGSVFTGGFPGTRPPRAPAPGPKRAKKRPKRRTIALCDGSKAKVAGRDVHAEIRVTLEQAIVGARVCIPTRSGKATIRIPAGTSSGTKLRLRGKGLAAANGKPAGNHYATVQIDVPKKISDEAASHLTKFMEAVAAERDDK